MANDELICPDNEEEIWEVINELCGAEKGRGYFELGNYAFHRGQFQRSLVLAEMARDIFLELDNCFEGRANCIASVAFSLNSLGERAKAIEEMERAVACFEEYSIAGERDMRRRLITWLYEENRYEEAFPHIDKCLDYAVYECIELDQAVEHSKYASGLCSLNREEEAIARYKKAREIFKQVKDVERVAETDFHIGRCYNHLKEGFEAEFFIRNALAVFDSSENEEYLGVANSQLGRALLQQENYEEALKHFEIARKNVLKAEEVNYYALYRVQRSMIDVLKSLGRDVEVDELERRNAVINETLKVGA